MNNISLSGNPFNPTDNSFTANPPLFTTASQVLRSYTFSDFIIGHNAISVFRLILCTRNQLSYYKKAMLPQLNLLPACIFRGSQKRHFTAGNPQTLYQQAIQRLLPLRPPSRKNYIQLDRKLHVHTDTFYLIRYSLKNCISSGNICKPLLPLIKTVAASVFNFLLPLETLAAIGYDSCPSFFQLFQNLGKPYCYCLTADFCTY